MPEAPTALNDWLRRKIATDPDDDLTAGNFDMGEPYEVTIYSDEAGCRVLYGRGIDAEEARHKAGKAEAEGRQFVQIRDRRVP